MQSVLLSLVYYVWWTVIGLLWFKILCLVVGTKKMSSNKEWEVRSFTYEKDDMNYRVIVAPFNSKTGTSSCREVEIRLPYKPRIGQLISCPKLY
jgi:hypothetical protein